MLRDSRAALSSWVEGVASSTVAHLRRDVSLTPHAGPRSDRALPRVSTAMRRAEALLQGTMRLDEAALGDGPGGGAAVRVRVRAGRLHAPHLVFSSCRLLRSLRIRSPTFTPLGTPRTMSPRPAQSTFLRRRLAGRRQTWAAPSRRDTGAAQSTSLLLLPRARQEDAAAAAATGKPRVASPLSVGPPRLLPPLQ